MDKKISLRLKAKEIRNSLDIANISNILTEKIRHLDIYKYSKNVMIFYPLKNEINLLKLLDDNKNFFLPRMNGKTLECCPYKKNDRLKTVKFNIKEPETECVECPNLDLVITPALAVDKKGNRLGYGGGFYDRFLSKINSKTLVALPQDLLFDNVPCEKFDIKIDYIITDVEFVSVNVF